MGVKLVLLVLASSLWQGLAAVVLVRLLGVSWKLLVVLALFGGMIKFSGIGTIAFAQRPNEAVFVELTSTLMGFVAAILGVILVVETPFGLALIFAN